VPTTWTTENETWSTDAEDAFIGAEFAGGPGAVGNPLIKIFDVNPCLYKDIAEHVSGYAGSFVRPDPNGTAYHFNLSNVLQAFGPSVPAFGVNGLWSDGAGANSIAVGKYRTFGAWDTVTAGVTKNQVGIGGVSNTASILEDDSPTVSERLEEVESVVSSSNTHLFSVFILKEDDETSYPGVTLDILGGTTQFEDCMINKKTGAVVSINSVGTTSCEVLDRGLWWQVCVFVQDNASGNNQAKLRIRPARGTVWGVGSVTATGTCVADWSGLHLDRTIPTAPIVGGASRATQAGQPTYTIANLDSRVATALAGDITGIFQWTPQFNSTDIDGTDRNILTSGNLTLAYDATSLIISDGTNTATVAHGGFSASDKITGTWYGDSINSKLRIGYINGAITWGTEQAYTGSFAPGAALTYFESNEEYQNLCSSPLYQGVGNDAQILDALKKLTKRSSIIQPIKQNIIQNIVQDIVR
jgi:hypothetical protein